MATSEHTTLEVREDARTAEEAVQAVQAVRGDANLDNGDAPKQTAMEPANSTIPSAISAAPPVKPKGEFIVKEINRFNITAEINPMFEVEKQQEKLSIMKAHLPLGRLVFLGVLAGWWLGLGVILVVTMAGGIPIQVRNDWPMLPKLVTGFLFPVGISCISLFGGELFTGNSMCMLIGLMAGRITLFELCYNWIVVLATNFAGAVLTVYLFGYITELHSAEPWNSYIRGIAVAKVIMKPEVAFFRAIAANALVCTCLLLGQSARDMIGKLAAMWFPIMMFAATGFEHSIANMAFVPLGMLYGADADWRRWLYQNLLIVIVGNTIGGGIVVGGAEYFLFDWTRLLTNVQQWMTHEGILSTCSQ